MTLQFKYCAKCPWQFFVETVASSRCNQRRRGELKWLGGPEMPSVLAEKPDPPTDLELTDQTERSVQLTWIPGDDHNSPTESMKCSSMLISSFAAVSCWNTIRSFAKLDTKSVTKKSLLMNWIWMAVGKMRHNEHRSSFFFFFQAMFQQILQLWIFLNLPQGFWSNMRTCSTSQGFGSTCPRLQALAPQRGWASLRTSTTLSECWLWIAWATAAPASPRANTGQILQVASTRTSSRK